MKETEYDCFQRMLSALREAEDAANKMFLFRPDQDWRAVAATLNLAQAGVRKKMDERGTIIRPGRLM